MSMDGVRLQVIKRAPIDQKKEGSDLEEKKEGSDLEQNKEGSDRSK